MQQEAAFQLWLPAKQLQEDLSPDAYHKLRKD